ncbi:MAG TPA: sugar phosphate isomerase/epimerase [Chitinophagaceae bacterium]|nr:sugar phosphate isomerase/epimerase [Chitinophagaceae bacterium]
MNRRQFVKNSGLVAAAAALGLPDFSAKKVGNFGIQLYTLRDIIGKDPKGVLQQLAAFGYKEIESYSGQQGIFWGMSNKEFKSYLDSIGMKMVSSHYDWKNDTEKLAPQAAEIGMKYLICPYLGKQKTMDDYKRTADEFNKAGEICKKNGIRFVYHNHGYSFEDAVNGLYPQDAMMQGTDPALVDFEMDIYWVATAGQDPEAWLKKYPNRWKLVHVKDRGKNFPAGQADASVDLGTGMLDFSKILKTARKTGVKHYIVEQERYDNTTSIKCAESNAAYMKKLSI